MPFTVRYPLIICLFIALLVGQLGCALGPQLLRPPPSERVRAQLGTIGILSARFAPEAKLEGPTRGKGSGAAKGAAKGFLGSIAAGLEAGAYAGEAGILAFALGLALAPPAAVIGGRGRRSKGGTRSEREASRDHAEERPDWPENPAGDAGPRSPGGSAAHQLRVSSPPGRGSN